MYVTIEVFFWKLNAHLEQSGAAVPFPLCMKVPFSFGLENCLRKYEGILLEKGYFQLWFIHIGTITLNFTLQEPNMKKHL